MVFREAARIVEPESLATFTFAEWIEQPPPNQEVAIRSPSVSLAAPEVILLAHFDRVPCHEAPFTRRNLFLRDEFTCQYCGRKCGSDHLSVDHVLPISGKSAMISVAATELASRSSLDMSPSITG